MPGAKADQTEAAEQKTAEATKALESLKSEVEGAEEVPLARVDETTKIENVPTVPKVVPESQKEVGRQSPETMLATDEQKKKEEVIEKEREQIAALGPEVNE